MTDEQIAQATKELALAAIEAGLSAEIEADAEAMRADVLLRAMRTASLRAYARDLWSRTPKRKRKAWRRRNHCRSPHLLLQRTGGAEL